MYQITVDDNILYDLRSNNRQVINPKLTLELNKNGKLTFTIPTTNPIGFNKLKSVFKVYQDDEQIFEGRALNDEKDFYNSNKIEVLGVLDYFNDSIVRPFELHNVSVKDFLKYLIDNHNSQVDSFKQFEVGNVDVVDFDGKETLYRKNEEYKTTREIIEDRLINKIGGYIRVRFNNGKRYIDYTQKSGDECSQPIEFRSNLLDLSQLTKGEDVKTCIIPIGKKDDNGNYVTIKSVNGGKDYIVNETAIKLYGKIVGIKQWDDVTEPGNLLRKAKEYLKNCSNLAYRIELSAVDLHLLDADMEKFKLGQYVNVISKPHGLNKLMQISKIIIDFERPDNTKISVGDTIQGLTDKQIKCKKEANSKLESANLKIIDNKKNIKTVDNKVTTVSNTVTNNKKQLKAQRNFIIMGL